MLKIDEAKTALNARVIAAKQEYQRSRSPEQRAEAVALMKEVSRIAYASMRKVLEAEAAKKS